MKKLILFMAAFIVTQAFAEATVPTVTIKNISDHCTCYANATSANSMFVPITISKCEAKDSSKFEDATRIIVIANSMTGDAATVIKPEESAEVAAINVGPSLWASIIRLPGDRDRENKGGYIRSFGATVPKNTQYAVACYNLGTANPSFPNVVLVDDADLAKVSSNCKP